MNDYIILKTSDLSLVKQFKVLYEGAGWQRGRTQSRQRTVTGKLDVQEGSGGERWAFAIRCPYDTVDPDWGNKVNLDTFADYKQGLYMVDHFGVEREIVIMGGQVESKPLTSVVDGDNIWISQLMVEAI